MFYFLENLLFIIFYRLRLLGVKILAIFTVVIETDTKKNDFGDNTSNSDRIESKLV